MDETEVKGKLISILEQIQALSGQNCPRLNGDLQPAESLQKFDSKIWPVAAGMLGAAIGETIPPEVNIFVDDATKQPLSIDQTVELVCEILKKQKKLEAAA